MSITSHSETTKRQLAVASGKNNLPMATANRRASGDGNGYDVPSANKNRNGRKNRNAFFPCEK